MGSKLRISARRIINMDAVTTCRCFDHRYLDKDQLLVLLQVQGCVNIRRDPFHLFGVAIVQHKPGILPHFIA